MKAYRDKDPVSGNYYYYFREGLALTCMACGEQFTKERPPVERHFDRTDADGPHWDIVHKFEPPRGCDTQHADYEQKLQISRWNDFKLSAATLISLHDRALRCLVANKIMTPSGRLEQLGMFAELVYEAIDEGVKTPHAMDLGMIQEKVEELDLEPL